MTALAGKILTTEMARRRGHVPGPAQEVESPMRPSEYSPLVVAKFWMNATKEGGCWVWEGPLTNGYGTFAPAQCGHMPAHRVAYELLVGPIPDGLELDHLCRNPPCINPNHLEPVTHAENCRRGEGFSGRNARKTECVNGHPLSGPNLYVDPKGRRQCRACRSAQMRAWHERNPGYHVKYRARKKAA